MATRRKKIFTIAFISLALAVIVFGYFNYQDFKKIFVERVSYELSSLTGQPVAIGDVSFGIPARIDVHDLLIGNPEAFDSGKLLNVKRLSLTIKLGELLKRKLYFKSIVVYSPELTLLRERELGVNISDTLVQLLSRPSDLEYKVDELKIVAGKLSYHSDTPYQISYMNLTFHNLSPDPGDKTLINGDFAFLGENKMAFAGWVFLAARPTKFHLSIFAEDFNLSALNGIQEKYLTESEKTKITLGLDADGDTESGVNFALRIQVTKAVFVHIKRDQTDLRLDARAFYNIPLDSLTLDEVILNADSVSSIQLKGAMTNIKKNPRYWADLKINRLDLASLNLFKNLDLNGVMVSDNLRIKGELTRLLPEISGSVKLKDASVETEAIDIQNIQSHFEFMSNARISLKGEASGKVLKAGKYLSGKPIDITLSKVALNTRGGSEPIFLAGSIGFSTMELLINREKGVSISSLKNEMEGKIEHGIFSGKSILDIENFQYGDTHMADLRSTFKVEYRDNVTTIRNLEFKTGSFASTADLVKLKFQRKEGLAAELKGVNLDYYDKKAQLKRFDLNINVKARDEELSGDFLFSASEVVYQNIPSANISGKGRFDKNEFRVTIPQAEIASGILSLSAGGKISKNPFPLAMNVMGLHLDLEALSALAFPFFKIPYNLSGNLKKASFEGIIVSADSWQGKAQVEGEKISLLKGENRSSIVKSAHLDARINFVGQDLEIKAEAGDENLGLIISGSIKGFMRKGKSAKIEVALPKTELTALRNSLWDVFPDKLLYAKLEGSLSSHLLFAYDNSGVKISGDLRLNNILIQGEYDEYAIGPVNGLVPIVYGQGGHGIETTGIPVLEREEFSRFVQYYSKETPEEAPNVITIDSLSYGFKLMENINIRIKPDGSTWNIGRISAQTFGGMLYGSAVVDFKDAISYSAAFLIDGLSLAQLCERIEPIEGYISGRVNGVANIKGTGTDASLHVGKADFWTYSTEDEKRKISRELLRQIGGPSLQMYLSDRSYNKGAMSLYLQNGDVIFKELEISNRNFLGITDLSVKVAPSSNRVALDQLLWTIREAAKRGATK